MSAGADVTGHPISAALRARLLAAGYSDLAVVSSVSPRRLASDLNIELHEALDILKIVSSAYQPQLIDGHCDVLKGSHTALDMLSEEQMQRHISTSCCNLDSILGGGIHCKEVTEIGGVPGIGKTQLGIQLAINAQIPLEYGGLGGKAVYIDTEGSFMVDRAYQIAEGCTCDILDDIAYGDEKMPVNDKLHPSKFLADIFYFRICSYTEQIAVINHMDKFLREHKDVRIVIIDSVTFHFRQDFDDFALRTRVLGGLSLKLMKVAKECNVAVVLFNQVTTKFMDGSFRLTLALGDSWSHSSTNRLILYWDGNERFAHLNKSPSLPPASAPFMVSSKGIRDVNTHKRARIM